ncbi:hypothetical protein J2S53_003623 [Actinopolyspora lacussalsi]|nr:hypothetical protein [Actinopolyspora lacussalsi]
MPMHHPESPFDRIAAQYAHLAQFLDHGRTQRLGPCAVLRGTATSHVTSYIHVNTSFTFFSPEPARLTISSPLPFGQSSDDAGVPSGCLLD